MAFIPEVLTRQETGPEYWAILLASANKVGELRHEIEKNKFETFHDVAETNLPEMRSLMVSKRDGYILDKKYGKMTDNFHRRLFLAPRGIFDLDPVERINYYNRYTEIWVCLKELNLGEEVSLNYLKNLTWGTCGSVQEELNKLMAKMEIKEGGKSSEVQTQPGTSGPERSASLFSEEGPSKSDVDTYMSNLRQSMEVQNPNFKDHLTAALNGERSLVEAQDFAKKMAAASLSSFKDIMSMFEYEGFDPFTTWAVLKASAGHLTESEFRNDMVMCSVLFLMRGTSIVTDKKLEKMSAEGKVLVSKLRKRYDIKAKLGDNSTKRTITLSRIAATFPQAIVCFLGSTGCTIQRPVSLSAMRSLFPNFGCHMRTSCFFSLIPRNRNYAPYIMATLHHQVLESKIINKDLKGKPLQTVMESVLTYAKSAFDSKITESPSYRLKLFNEQPQVHETDLKLWELKFKELYSTDVIVEFGLE